MKKSYPYDPTPAPALSLALVYINNPHLKTNRPDAHKLLKLVRKELQQWVKQMGVAA